MAEKEATKDTKETKEEKDPKGQAETPPKKSKLLFIILGIAIVGGGGGGFLGYKMFFKKPVEESKDASADESGEKKDAKDESASKSDSEEPKKHEKAKNDPNAFGDTFVVPKMDINLDNPLENRYLHLSLTLEYSGGKSQAEDLKKREPQIRDVILTASSTRTRAELLSPYGKQRLRQEIFNKLNEVLDKPIKKVYFTDFLVE